ncbi:hypothetical protein Hamer_G003617 [Homarus americanus]|uniref:Uncharacterized protein n=1 Tax=Homarus americanus TaxID=6706 RepID=A0A8J5JUF1_HOMAM|nr:hypothetical protein Hamer_G003617 [Homarus americanus]
MTPNLLFFLLILLHVQMKVGMEGPSGRWDTLIDRYVV